MSYYSRLRSNLFRVRDVRQFAEFCSKFGLKMTHDPSANYVCFFSKGTGLPLADPATGEPVDFMECLALHLEPGEVAEVREISYNGDMIMTGYSMAVDSSGRVVSVSLEDIYTLVRVRWGVRLNNPGA